MLWGNTWMHLFAIKGEYMEKIPLTLYICMLIKATHILEINYTQFICAHFDYFPP